jgi:hypothetical protein
MSEKVDLVGRRFGKLLVLSLSAERKNGLCWNCICDCGNPTVNNGNSLKNGNTKSCGCGKSEATARRNFKHGQADTRLHTIWKAIKQRILNPRDQNYSVYGGRGITLYTAWVYSFVSFRDYVMSLPKSDLGLTLDRINNNGNYEPGNLRWATQKEQCRNNSRNRYIDTPQGKMLISDAAEIAGITRGAMHGRVKRKWAVENILDKGYY